ncbi:MAG: hypothetical protein ABW104_01305 [Candidatus Thiodiazotropha sp. 6PLUC2]
MIFLARFVLGLTFIQLAGCSSDSVKLTTYEALEFQRHQQCLKQLDSRACDEQAKSYEEYKAMRDKHTKAE